MTWIKKAEWLKPDSEAEHRWECPPRIRLKFGPGEEPHAPGSIWQCDKCGLNYELTHYEMGWAVWKELPVV